MSDKKGVWVSFYTDGHGQYSCVTVFQEEVEALRHALDGSQSIEFLEFGERLGYIIKNQKDDK